MRNSDSQADQLTAGVDNVLGSTISFFAPYVARLFVRPLRALGECADVIERGQIRQPHNVRQIRARVPFLRSDPDSTSPFGQFQVYSADGFPIGIREAADGTTGILYNEVLSLTARQQVRRERYHGSNNLVSERTFDDNTGRLATIRTGTFSGGVVGGQLQDWTTNWDKNGNLTMRHDRTAGADSKEVFGYDALDRLTTVNQTIGSSPAINTLTLAYDQLGNITMKSGSGAANLGAYAYNSTPAQTGCALPAGPHAVSLVAGKSYCYDENGNNTQVRKFGSAIRTIAYTGFDLPEQIVRNEPTSEGAIQAEVSFKYAIDRSVYERLDNDSTRTRYVGNVEFIADGRSDIVKRYIGGFLVITKVLQGGNATYDYLLRDSLGSIDTVASETGALRSRQSFNAHGQRRNAATAGGGWTLLTLLQAAAFANTTSPTTQGFTGHEQLDQVGLVHMGARLYDAEIGRFLQADDFVEPEATQGLNRYSYVLNNPLTATDPTGNFSLRQAIGIVIGVVAAIISQQYWAIDKLISFGIAVAGGFASAAISTGSLKAGLWGAVSAAVFWGIGTQFSKAWAFDTGTACTQHMTRGAVAAKVAAHAATGGTLSVLQGGKFGHGFFSAGFTEALSPAVGQMGDGKSFGSVLGRTAASATIGGTVSKLTGGSFANGAVTAAFTVAFGNAISETIAFSGQETMEEMVDPEEDIGSGEAIFNEVVTEFRDSGSLPSHIQIAYSDDLAYFRNNEIVRFRSAEEARAAGFYGAGIAGYTQTRVVDGQTQARILILRGAAHPRSALVAMTSMDRATWRPIVFTRHGMMRFTIAHEIRHALDSSLGSSSGLDHWRANEYGRTVCRQLGGGCG